MVLLAGLRHEDRDALRILFLDGSENGTERKVWRGGTEQHDKADDHTNEPLAHSGFRDEKPTLFLLSTIAGPLLRFAAYRIPEEAGAGAGVKRRTAALRRRRDVPVTGQHNLTIGACSAYEAMSVLAGADSLVQIVEIGLRAVREVRILIALRPRASAVVQQPTYQRRSSPQRNGRRTQRDHRAALPQSNRVVQIARHPHGQRQRPGEPEKRHADDQITGSEQAAELRVVTQQAGQAFRMDQAPGAEREGAQGQEFHRAVDECHGDSLEQHRGRRPTQAIMKSRTAIRSATSE